MKPNQLILTAVAGVQIAFPVFAGGDAPTNSTSAIQSQISNPAAAGTTTNSEEEAEIQTLQREIQALDQKVQLLEQQREGEQQASTLTNRVQIQELNQKVRILARQRELDKEDAAAAAKTQPQLRLDDSGFTLESADTNFVINLHGLVQLDSRTFFDDHNLVNSGFLLRRARPIITGTVFHDFDFNFTPDFGGNTVQIQDAYLNYRCNPGLQLEAGKFKSPVGLEQLQSDPYTFFNERSLATDLAPNRDLGVELHGDLTGGVASYAAGIFDGAPDYSGTTFNADTDNDKAFAGRLFLQPWKTSDLDVLKGLGFGAGGSYESDRNGAAGLTPGYTTDGQQKFFTYAAGVVANGQHWRLSPQGYYYYGPFGFLGEYAVSDQDVKNGAALADLRNTAWEVSGGWVLTGEDASYNGVTPRHPFNLHGGGWGAWQVVGRYAELNIDGSAFPTFATSATSASSAHAWSAGLNWYLNRNVRLNTSFSHTVFGGYTGGAPAVPAQAENVFFTRIQLAF
ncbi:MAG TPA: porin [Candidatus Saccharimonadales bacterium]|nr:porin [Candidatus Saccharimonadales bacterium]